MFTVRLEVFLITALGRLQMMCKFWALPSWVFGNGKRWVLKGCISTFHIPYLEVIHVVVQQTVSESYECFMLIWGDIPLEEIHLKRPCILIFFWKTDKWDPSSSSLITHFTPLFPNKQTKLQHTSPSIDEGAGVGGGLYAVGQARDWGSGGKMTGPSALPPVSSMLLEEVGSHLGVLIPSTVKHEQ